MSDFIYDPKSQIPKANGQSANSQNQMDVLSHKTHQDLINTAYKAAEKLKIAPWVLLRAAGWGNFTKDHGALYKGPIIDDIKELTVEQEAALKAELGL